LRNRRLKQQIDNALSHAWVPTCPGGQQPNIIDLATIITDRIG
jgi:hypothetical protein